MRRQLLRAGLLALGLLVLSYILLVEISALTTGLAKAILGVALLYFVIKYCHNEIDAIRAYREYPIVYAAAIVGYALIIALAMGGS